MSENLPQAEGQNVLAFFQGYQDWPLEDYDEVTSDHPPYGAFCSICLHEHVEHLRRSLERDLSKN